MASKVVMSELPHLHEITRTFKVSNIDGRRILAHWMLDRKQCDQIVKTMNISPDDPLVIEFGAGPGIMTEALLDTKVQKVITTETVMTNNQRPFKDNMDALSKNAVERLKVVTKSPMVVMRYPEKYLEIKPAADVSLSKKSLNRPRIHLVGNYNYIVSSPILRQLFRTSVSATGIFGLGYDVQMTFWMQRKRMRMLTADPGAEDRERTSVLAQTTTNMRKVYGFPFDPLISWPKLDVAMQFTPRMGTSSDILKGVSAENLDYISEFLLTRRNRRLEVIFSFLEKEPQIYTVDKKILKPFFDENPNLYPTMTPNQMSNADFIQMTNWFDKKGLDMYKRIFIPPKEPVEYLAHLEDENWDEVP